MALKQRNNNQGSGRYFGSKALFQLKMESAMEINSECKVMEELGRFVLLLLCWAVLFLLPDCSGGEGNPPVYNDQGVCVANCSVDNGGGRDNLPDAVKDNDGDGTTDPGTEDPGTDIGVQPDYGPVVCPAVMPAICGKDMEARCFVNFEGKKSCLNGQSYHDGQACTTDEACQIIPADKLPPCECWGEVPCTLAAWAWQAPGPFDEQTWTLAVRPQDHYCVVQASNFMGFPDFFIPGTDYVISLPTETIIGAKITLIDNGNQYRYEWDDGSVGKGIKKVTPQ